MIFSHFQPNWTSPSISKLMTSQLSYRVVFGNVGYKVNSSSFNLHILYIPTHVLCQM